MLVCDDDRLPDPFSSERRIPGYVLQPINEGVVPVLAHPVLEIIPGPDWFGRLPDFYASLSDRQAQDRRRSVAGNERHRPPVACVQRDVAVDRGGEIEQPHGVEHLVRIVQIPAGEVGPGLRDLRLGYRLTLLNGDNRLVPGPSPALHLTRDELDIAAARVDRRHVYGERDLRSAIGWHQRHGQRRRRIRFDTDGADGHRRLERTVEGTDDRPFRYRAPAARRQGPSYRASIVVRLLYEQRPR